MASAMLAEKLVLKSTSKISLSDRFKLFRQKAQNARMNKALQGVNPETSKKNKLLAQRMATKPSVLAALKIKRRSIRNRLSVLDKRRLTTNVRSEQASGTSMKKRLQTASLRSRLNPNSKDFAENRVAKKTSGNIKKLAGHRPKNLARRNISGNPDISKKRQISRKIDTKRKMRRDRFFQRKDNFQNHKNHSFKPKGKKWNQRKSQQYRQNKRGKKSNNTKLGKNGQPRRQRKVFNKDQLDKDLDNYMSKTKNRLNADLDDYMSANTFKFGK